MRTLEEIEKMFTEIGLGSKEERERFLVPEGIETEKGIATKGIFIRLSNASDSTEEDDNAKLA